MREDLCEPQYWRTSASRNQSWSSRRRSQERERAQLAADAVDAALAEVATELSHDRLDTPDIIASLAKQLDLLERQREQLQELLDHAQVAQ